MKTYLSSALFALCLSTSVGADTSLSISVGEPGFYGAIHIGDYPQPRLIYREPVLMRHVAHPGPPVYVYVPHTHAVDWADHCHAYGYCDRPVYFVNATWYHDVYVPEYHKRHGHPGKGKGRGRGKGNKR